MLVSSGGIKYETSSQMRMRKNNGQEKSDINEKLFMLDLENRKSTPLENSYAENIYTKYSDNEFFCINQDNIDLLYENKKAVLEKYDDLY